MYELTKKKKPTRRGVIWLGQTCNLRCYFCYYITRIKDKTHPEHKFFSLNKAKKICYILRTHYDLNSIDIQGGEPTIYPHIFELLDYCNSIGLKPTLITNGVALNNYNFARKFKEHNIYDFLVSLQGIDDNYDRVVGVKGAFKKQMKGLENISSLGIPIRINAVLSKEILQDISKIVELAIKYKARVVNFIGFNNTGDQAYLRDVYNLPFYKLLANILEPNIELLESHGIEVNVRFIPFCVFKEKYRKNVQNSKQQIFDLHEWEKSHRLWINKQPQKEADRETDEPYDDVLALIKYKLDMNMIESAKRNVQLKDNYVYKKPYDYQMKIFNRIKNICPDTINVPNYSKVEHFYFDMEKAFYTHKEYSKKCDKCSLKNICDGIHKDYLEKIGDDEFNPVKLNQEVVDPLFYMKEQLKVVENEEREWFFDNHNSLQL